MSIEWVSAQMVVSTLGEKFVGSVLKNMPQQSTVRFGETGEGRFPNYQVERESGERTLWRGNGHGEWPEGVTEFNEGKVSIPYSKKDLLDEFIGEFREPRKTSRS